jgi:hypothetical protein
MPVLVNLLGLEPILAINAKYKCIIAQLKNQGVLKLN